MSDFKTESARPFGRGRNAKRAALALLLAGAAVPVQALGDSAQLPSPGDDRSDDIIVIGQRLFHDIQPERDFDEEDIASYGASTVDELLGEVEAELGPDEDEPLILVNGERINSRDEIGGLPVEALQRVQVLPRGSATRAGGRPGQRVVNLTLRKETRSATLSAAHKVATEADWYGSRGDAVLTRIKDSTRINLTFRARKDSSLLESERGIIQPDPRLPYALGGNVIGYPDQFGEIDPLLSAMAGELVTVAPIGSGSSPTLADFAANANQAAVTDLGDFRTLRPSSRNFDVNGTFSTRLAPWLSSSTSVRLNRNTRSSLRGLPSAVFILSPDNPASPFSTDVGLAFYGRDPLRTRSRRESAEVNQTLNARLGRWTSNFNARHSISWDVTRTGRQASFGAIPLDDGVNPFGTDLSDLIPVRTDRASGRSTASLAQLSFTGPALRLPAGDLVTTIEGRVASNRLRSRTDSVAGTTERRFRRSEQSIRGSVDVPIASRDAGFLAAIGDLNADGEYNIVHYSDAGTLNQYSAGLTWEPVPVVRLRGEIGETDRPASIQVRGNPVVVTSGVRAFDPLTGETVDVVQITGGNPDLRPETTKLRRVSGLLRLVPRLNLQLNAEYTDSDTRNLISSLPEASAAVMLAFPDRFIRDSNGVLTTIDLRPVNFASHREKRLRYGFSLSTGGRGRARFQAAPASEEETPDAEIPADAPPPAASRRSAPPMRFQLSVNHGVVFSDEIRIRPGLDPVDLLDGGAIGIAGGRVRHQLDGSAALTSGGTGVRLGVAWRGASTLESRFGGVTDTLRFAPVLAVNLRAFADMRRFFPDSGWARGTRLSLNLLNITNDRQEVRNSAGATPLQYQAAYRDPIGRTVELQIRKTF